MNTIDHTSEYLTKHNLPVDGLMEGLVHYGDSQLNTICKEALSQDSEIEFYYANNEDEIADKLSYRLNPGKTA
jgi:hypothetical protein